MATPVTTAQKVLPPAKAKKLDINDLLRQLDDSGVDARATLELFRRRETQVHRDIHTQPIASSESAPKSDTPSGVWIGASAKRSVVSKDIETKKSIVIKAESAESARKDAGSSKDKRSGGASNVPPPGTVSVTIGEWVDSSVIAGGTIHAEEGITIE